MALSGPSSSTNARDVDGGYGQGRFRGSREGIDWVPNATNRHHRVDFRYAWMPSPEMPRPPLPDAALPGIEGAEDEREHHCRHGCQHGHGHGHGHGHEHGPGHHPLGPRRATPRSSRVCGGDENQNLQSQNQNLNVNLNVNPNPTSKRSASGSTSTSTGTGTGTSSTQASAVGHGGHCSHCSHCKRSHRSSGTLSGSGSGAPAYAYNHALQAQSHPAAGDDLPARVPRLRQDPASASARAPAARPCARPRPPAREQEQEPELVRRKSWLSVLSPKKLFSPRKRRSVAAAAAETSGHTYLTNASPNADGDEDENEAGFYANTGATPNTNANAELLGRTHAAHVQVQRREVHPAEWRAYGMWARPWLGHEYGDMVVRNATPSEPPRELSPPQVEEMIATLWEDEQPHPERWIPRVQHPSLPPRPELWPTPRQTHDPLPEELQLNPFLVHNLLGRPPLTFDLRLRAAEVEVGDPRLSPARYANLVPEDILLLYPPPEAAADPPFCEGPNGAQPATYPGVSRLRITALAGDAHHVFPWPVTVLPHHAALPVLVADVVHALIANFEERLARAEFDGLSDTRRTMAYQAYWRRMRLPVAGRTPPETDGLRRVDYLGDAIWFRGLEPNKDGEGFVLFLGPPP